MDGLMDGWMDGWMDGCTDGRTDGCAAGWRDSLIDGCMDGGMDSWMDSWMDGWMDGWCLNGHPGEQCIIVHSETAVSQWDDNLMINDLTQSSASNIDEAVAKRKSQEKRYGAGQLRHEAILTLEAE
ncbi:hypothetical protein AK812_SmicGene10284 [Symbiodinium microadriaticum]|uniref:Uncharacterized protein n=1 Tax=Symbiodinium microadriaticum TaxID=2951 RepID=A0A1Q9EG84_SYMMI|nr:hypothetical protein AK812_SmicGene10284 [Symbiodinium microadriaticum]